MLKTSNDTDLQETEELSRKIFQLSTLEASHDYYDVEVKLSVTEFVTKIQLTLEGAEQEFVLSNENITKENLSEKVEESERLLNMLERIRNIQYSYTDKTIDNSMELENLLREESNSNSNIKIFITVSIFMANVIRLLTFRGPITINYMTNELYRKIFGSVMLERLASEVEQQINFYEDQNVQILWKEGTILINNMKKIQNVLNNIVRAMQNEFNSKLEVKNMVKKK